MKIVIEIPENMDLRNYDIPYDILNIITSGKILPKYHGRLISEEDMLSVILFSKLFDDAKVGEVKEALLNIPTIVEGSK